MFCTQCGRKCEPDDRFCIDCGTPLVVEFIPDSPKKKGRLWVPIVLLAVMMTVGISAFFLFRGYSDPEMPWFTLRNGVLYFDSTLYDGGEELTVPATIDGHAVERISTYCFSSAEDIAVIHLPEGIDQIGDYAFSQCSHLRAVKLPETVSKIGIGVFYGCNSLEAVYIPGSLTHAGMAVFTDCTALQHVFYSGSAQQWEALHIDYLPENTSIYLVDGDSYEEYLQP